MEANTYVIKIVGVVRGRAKGPATQVGLRVRKIFPTVEWPPDDV